MVDSGVSGSVSLVLEAMQHGFDISKLYQEAQCRWLKPSEVLFILQNHERCRITPQPPNKPPSGSLFLFNRRVLRFFRKDGHVWRRKKDGRTIGEAHERLKVGNIDALSCYYAHGEENSYFQRRSYWMLDPAYEHIVLVHYREVVEGRCNIPGSLSTVSANSSLTFNQSTSPGNYPNLGTCDLSSHSAGSLGEVNSESTIGNNLVLDVNVRSENLGMPSQPQENQELKMLELQLSLDEDNCSLSDEEKFPPYPTLESMQGNTNYARNPAQDVCSDIPSTSTSESTQHSHHIDRDVGSKGLTNSYMLPQSTGDDHKQQIEQLNSERMVQMKALPFWKEMLELTFSTHTSMDTQEMPLNPFITDVHGSSLGRVEASEDRLLAEDMRSYSNEIKLVSSDDKLISLCEQPEKLIGQQVDYGWNIEDNNNNTSQGPESHLQLQPSAVRMVLLGSDISTELPMSSKQLQEVEDAIPYYTEEGGCEGNSLVLSKENSIEWMDNMQLTFKNTGYSSNISEILFDQNYYVTALEVDSSLTVAQKQLFSIHEISPEWAFSTESTKVIIVGEFFCNYLGIDWKVMFGDIEVPVDIIQNGVLRCQAPPHVAGSVSLCVTSGNRESCSEVREFEYRVKPETYISESNLQRDSTAMGTEELSFLTKFVQILLCGNDATSSQNEEKYTSPEDPSRKLKITTDQSTQVIESQLVSNDETPGTVESLFQQVLEDKLKHWLSSKSQENVLAGCSLSRKEQSVIHMISGLGFEWALTPILNAGVGVNFRDPNGWTALHWAAHFGREKMVAALLATDASPGAVTDPTAQDPVGKTPASIAAARGHKGLAGYLSEVALTSHLFSLTLEEIEISKGSAELLAERAVESVSERNIQVEAGATEDQLSLKDSLAAVRNAAQAAARIQSAFRAHSFRKKQCKAAHIRDELNMTPQEIHEISSASKLLHGHHDKKFQTAACCIQRRYRGWKGRRNFLTLREHVVKIQAHVRGHQARTKYKEFLWMVNVLEKAVLRWRRGGGGLRGFKLVSESIDETDDNDDDILKVFRKLKVDAAIDEAVSRVLSMVESPHGRQQYRRMLESYKLARDKWKNVIAAVSNIPGNSESQDAYDEDDEFMLQILLGQDMGSF